MFNSMEPHELTLGVGRVLRMAADTAADGTLTEGYGRSQLLSGSSVARHLAAEEADAAEQLHELRTALLDALQGEEDAVVRAREAVAAANTGPQVGTALVALFGSFGDADSELRRRLHRILADMAEREVAALADPRS